MWKGLRDWRKLGIIEMLRGYVVVIPLSYLCV